MQQMQHPEERSYGEGYQSNPEYAGYYDRQSEYPEQGAQPGQQYASSEAAQQKIQPLSGGVNRVLAILSLAFGSAMMAVAIPLFAISIVVLANGWPNRYYGVMIAGVVLASCLLALALASLVFAIIQVALIERRRAMQARPRSHS